MLFSILIAFFLVASAAYLVAWWLAAEIRWMRPDLADRIRKPWLFTGYVTSLLELSRELAREDRRDEYRRIRSISRALRVLQGIEWALLAAFFALLLWQDMRG